MTATGDDPQQHPDPLGPGGDYSYDLVHEEVPESRRAERVTGPRHPAPEAEPDAGGAGDYSYDLAHEVPPSRRR